MLSLIKVSGTTSVYVCVCVWGGCKGEKGEGGWSEPPTSCTYYPWLPPFFHSGSHHLVFFCVQLLCNIMKFFQISPGSCCLGNPVLQPFFSYHLYASHHPYSPGLLPLPPPPPIPLHSSVPMGYYVSYS